MESQPVQTPGTSQCAQLGSKEGSHTQTPSSVSASLRKKYLSPKHPHLTNSPCSYQNSPILISIALRMHCSSHLHLIFEMAAAIVRDSQLHPSSFLLGRAGGTRLWQ